MDMCRGGIVNILDKGRLPGRKIRERSQKRFMDVVKNVQEVV